MGRPAFQPTDEMRANVREWRAAQVGTAEIARRLGTNKVTLLKYFRAELNDATPGDKVEHQVRPPFQPDPQQREIVEILAAVHVPTAQIAASLGLDVEVLKEHFAAELANGPAKRNSDVLLATYRSAVAGNTSAQRLWHAMTAVPVRPAAGEEEPDAAATEQRQSLSPLGKKVAQQTAAQTAGEGTDWGDDLKFGHLTVVKK